jgi:predicted transcriptional regulator
MKMKKPNRGNPFRHPKVTREGAPTTDEYLPTKRKKMTPIEALQTISHKSRWPLLKALRRPMTAQDLADETGLSVANVIYHMRFLEAAEVIHIGDDPAYKSRQMYTRRGFLAEIAVDYDKPSIAEATFTKVKRKA